MRGRESARYSECHDNRRILLKSIKVALFKTTFKAVSASRGNPPESQVQLRVQNAGHSAEETPGLGHPRAGSEASAGASATPPRSAKRKERGAAGRRPGGRPLCTHPAGDGKGSAQTDEPQDHKLGETVSTTYKSTESAFPSCHSSQTENIPQDGQAHSCHPQGVEGASMREKGGHSLRPGRRAADTHASHRLGPAAAPKMRRAPSL